MVCNGLGLFIACSDDVHSVTIPSSTPICGYSRGVFTEYNIIDSDKTVLYRFTNINQGVLFEKKVIRLIDVIHIMMDRYTISKLDQADSMLLGHIVTTYSKDDYNGVIVPDENYKNNYFIPDHYINNNIEDNSSSNDDNSNDMVYNDTDTTSDIIQTILDDNRDDVDGIHDDDDDNDIDAGSDSVVVKAFDINATNIGNVSMIVIKIYCHCIQYCINLLL
jgi:hypothetical protein